MAADWTTSSAGLSEYASIAMQASEIDLGAIWAKVEALSKVKR